MTCSLDSCTRAVHAREWCEMHYRRWLRTGTPQGVGRVGRPRTAVSYDSVHQWLATDRGPASGYICVDCDGRAAEWSYQGGDPNELRDDEGRRFSTDLSRYVARCLMCHRSKDAAHRRWRIPSEVYERHDAGETAYRLAREFGYHPATLWRYLTRYERPKGVLRK